MEEESKYLTSDLRSVSQKECLPHQRLRHSQSSLKTSWSGAGSGRGFTSIWSLWQVEPPGTRWGSFSRKRWHFHDPSGILRWWSQSVSGLLSHLGWISIPSPFHPRTQTWVTACDWSQWALFLQTRRAWWRQLRVNSSTRHRSSQALKSTNLWPTWGTSGNGIQQVTVNVPY